jgi:hypothetical protein
MDVINMISKVPGLPDAPVVTGERYEFGVLIPGRASDRVAFSRLNLGHLVGVEGANSAVTAPRRVARASARAHARQPSAC